MFFIVDLFHILASLPKMLSRNRKYRSSHDFGAPVKKLEKTMGLYFIGAYPPVSTCIIVFIATPLPTPLP